MSQAICSSFHFMNKLYFHSFREQALFDDLEIVKSHDNGHIDECKHGADPGDEVQLLVGESANVPEMRRHIIIIIDIVIVINLLSLSWG